MYRLSKTTRLLLSMAMLLLPLLAFLTVKASQKSPGTATVSDREDSVYLYGLFHDVTDCDEVTGRIKTLSLHPTVLLSIEDGSNFMLDKPDREALLACGIDALRASSHTVKALFLQDTSFLQDTAEAQRRASKLQDFLVKHPGSLAGAQVDIEPYVTEDWSCGTVPERRQIFRSLSNVLRQVREKMPGLPLGVAVGWWTPATAADYPEGSPASLFQAVDELYLMVYGDEGGPVVAGSAERILSRINTPEFFSGPGRVYVALATYEYQSPQQLQTELDTIRRELAVRPHFAGTAVFHAQSEFNVPLVRLVSGVVTDSAGKTLPGVDVQADGAHDTTNRCGKFMLRGSSALKAQMVFRKDGFKTLQVPVEVRRLGVEKEMGKIVLQK